MYIGSTAEMFEDFIGLYESSETDAATITTVIKDVLLRCNLRTEDCRGQCYDGASNMSGRLMGLQQELSRRISKRHMYTVQHTA